MRQGQLVSVPPMSSTSGAKVPSVGLGRTPREVAGQVLLRKEVIQPHLPVRLPCYDFVPITELALDGCLLTVGPPASGTPSFRDVTGGVYKARERIHRGVLTRGY